MTDPQPQRGDPLPDPVYARLYAECLVSGNRTSPFQIEASAHRDDGRGDQARGQGVADFGAPLVAEGGHAPTARGMVMRGSQTSRFSRRTASLAARAAGVP